MEFKRSDNPEVGLPYKVTFCGYDEVATVAHAYRERILFMMRMGNEASIGDFDRVCSKWDVDASGASKVLPDDVERGASLSKPSTLLDVLVGFADRTEEVVEELKYSPPVPNLSEHILLRQKRGDIAQGLVQAINKAIEQMNEEDYIEEISDEEWDDGIRRLLGE